MVRFDPSPEQWKKADLYNKSIDYLEGKGVAKDEAQAFTLNQQAANAGYAGLVLPQWNRCGKGRFRSPQMVSEIST